MGRYLFKADFAVRVTVLFISLHALDIQAAVCSTGTKTVLELQSTPHAREMDGAEGHVNLYLKDRENGRLLWRDKFTGQAACYGFNAHRGEHMLGALRQNGASIMLAGIYFIPEKNPKLHAIPFWGKINGGFTSVASADLNYLAIVGSDENGLGLFLFDSRAETIRRIGDAPAPPPLSTGEYDLNGGPWEWGRMPDTAYSRMDAGIITFFENDVLKVSYGKDSALGRAKKREVKTWELSKIVDKKKD